MPSGHTHDAVTWFLVTPVALATWVVSEDAVGTCLTASAFAFAGTMFSGDLDLPSLQYRRWGRLRWLWKPYQWVIPHRSVLSHGILVGPLLRLTYLAALVMGLAALVMRAWSGHWGFAHAEIDLVTAGAARLDARGWACVGYTMLGLWLGGASHSLADWGWSAVRRRHRHG